LYLKIFDVSEMIFHPSEPIYRLSETIFI